MRPNELERIPMEELKEGYNRKFDERELLFTPGALESYYRDRYDRWDRLTDELANIKQAIVERGGTI